MPNVLVQGPLFLVCVSRRNCRRRAGGNEDALGRTLSRKQYIVSRVHRSHDAIGHADKRKRVSGKNHVASRITHTASPQRNGTLFHRATT